MRTVHFLDLEDRAHRGSLERGLRYIRVHTMRDANRMVEEYQQEEPPLWYSPFAYEFLPLGGAAKAEFVAGGVYPVLMASTHGSTYRSDVHAGDAGLWKDPASSYINLTNYTLDVNALLRDDIVIGGEVIRL